MIKSIIKFIFFNRFTAKLLIKPILKLDNFIYLLIGQYAPLASDSEHPKHDIVNYAEWFITKLKPKMTILDVGCNTGQMTQKISHYVDKSYGIEIDRSLYTIAKNKSSDNLIFINADATQYDYSNLQNIDCVTLSNVLEHIEDRITFLKSLNFNIKWVNKAHYLIRVPMIDRHWVVLLKKQYGVEYRLDKTHFIEYTKETFFREIESAGLLVKSFDVRWGEIYAVVNKR